MIDAFNTETAHHYGDAMPQLLKFRYREFVERHKYQVPSFNGLEYDQYDTPSAVYLTWRDDNEKIRAAMRILPTNRPYMIQQLWPQTIKDVPLPNSPTTWEATRFFVDREMDQKLRRRAHGEILCAMLEFGLHYGIRDYIAIAAPKLWNYTFRRCGWPATPIGPVTDIGYSEEIQSCIMNVNPEILHDVRRTMDIRGPVLSEERLSRDEQLLVDRAVFSQLNVWPMAPARGPGSAAAQRTGPRNIQLKLE